MFCIDANVYGRPSVRANQEVDPDTDIETTAQGQGFLNRIISVIRGVLTGGRAFLTGQTQRIIEYITTILGHLTSATNGNLRSRRDEVERELMKVAKDTERYTERQ